MTKAITRFVLLTIALGAAAARHGRRAARSWLARAEGGDFRRGRDDPAGRKDAFPLLRQLRTEAVRVNLYWSDVAAPEAERHRPADPACR